MFLISGLHTHKTKPDIMLFMTGLLYSSNEVSKSNFTIYFFFQFIRFQSQTTSFSEKQLRTTCKQQRENRSDFDKSLSYLTESL